MNSQKLSSLRDARLAELKAKEEVIVKSSMLGSLLVYAIVVVFLGLIANLNAAIFLGGGCFLVLIVIPRILWELKTTIGRPTLFPNRLVIVMLIQNLFGLFLAITFGIGAFIVANIAVENLPAFLPWLILCLAFALILATLLLLHPLLKRDIENLASGKKREYSGHVQLAVAGTSISYVVMRAINQQTIELGGLQINLTGGFVFLICLSVAAFLVFKVTYFVGKDFLLFRQKKRNLS